MSTIKSDALASTHGPRAGYTLHEDRPNLFLAGEITQEYLPKVRIVTLPLMMASADDTARTADPACSTQNCPDSTTLVGCQESPDDGTSTDTTTDTTGGGTGTSTDTTSGRTSPGG
jgi:hypothetical protein